MNRKAFWIVLLALGLTCVVGCGSSSNNNNIEVSITQPPPGFVQPGSAAIPVTATVSGDSAHAGVTWSCTPGNSAATCGSFTPTTTPSGTPTMYLPPTSAVGAVTITATSVTNTAAFANAIVQISTSGGIAGNYAFYATGLDANSVYSVAGAVTIASNGTIMAGEQDYNDASGVNEPDDTISSGVLAFDPSTGLGTLTLTATKLGQEVFALNFVNSNHALIIEADGLATSSGSLDLQTLPSTLSGGFAFTLSGAGNTGKTVFYGGVFTVNGTSAMNGMFDKNDEGSITLGATFNNAMLSAPDTFGRGTFTGTGIATTIAYYIIGPEVMRIIDVDTTSTGVGSAFGQGASAGNFNNASIGNSVFSVQSNFAGNLYAAVGQIVPFGGNFNGVADVNEEEVGFLDAQVISGTYSVASNGYGNLMILPVETLGDVSHLGIYATDPTLNLNDPNNTTSPGPESTTSGALVVDLDGNVAGSGVLVPQTDNSTASFAGNYALGFQDFIDTGIESGEFDFVGNATATAAAPSLLTGNGTVSDPFDLLGGTTFNPSASFTSPFTPDPANLGRYEISPFSVTVVGVTTPIPYLANVYQADGGQLFWLEDGADGQGSVFSGQIQQQTTLPISDAKKAAAKKTQK
ncbi:MAG TPA: hypothetical protein VN884_04055 [Candidatus Sulfotelmatobacter sp.]|nr:hypothetical protein [Candidatus Sulfotelmatobacter sp.]